MSTTVQTEIRPFHVDIPEEQIDDLRRRIEATRWSSKELVDDRSQGVQLATVKELARYWVTDYDLGRLEEKLNALPQFTTEIDGVDIHFIHVRSKHEDALPLIMTHGWPGSVIELLETVGPLTDPTAHGGTPGTHSTWCCRPCLATASRASRPSSAGTPPASHARGRSSWTASATRATSPRGATWAPTSPTRWAAKRPRGCSASTSTCSPRRSLSRTNCRPSPSRNARRTTRSPRS